MKHIIYLVPDTSVVLDQVYKKRNEINESTYISSTVCDVFCLSHFSTDNQGRTDENKKCTYFEIIIKDDCSIIYEKKTL